ncbi:MAG: glycosyltransferase [Bacteroidales bacterium]|nr:glycosyltransferase [Bacteroidales bacterium]
MKDELISVIVPIFNIENYLVQCIESIINQTYQNLEIILVNDGSTDRSSEICNKYKFIDKRIVVINKDNGGLSDARNAGIESAKGKYIAFVDGDDWIENTMYENLIKSIINHKADISFGIIERETRKYFENSISNKEVVLVGDTILDAFIYPEFKPHILKSACDKLYTRDIIGDTRFIVGIHGEDGPFNILVLHKSKKCVFVPKIVYHYRDVRQGNISSCSVISKRLFTDRLPIALEQIKLLEKFGRNDLAERQQAVYVDNLLSYYLKIESIEKSNDKYLYRNNILKLLKENEELLHMILKRTNTNNRLKIKIIIFLISPKLFLNIFKLLNFFSE